MLITLIRKEVLEHLMTLRFGLTCLLCLVALCLGTYVNLQEYKKDLADYHTSVSMHRYELESYTEPWQLMWRGVKVDTPLNAMRIFVARTGNRGAQVTQITQDTEPQPAEGARINPIEWLFPRIDLTFFVGVVMSLLALVFSYDAISGEKERGTLRLMLSYSVPRDLCLMAKWIGGFITLILPFTLALICALVIVLGSPEVQLTSDHWLQLGLLYVISIAYLTAVYSLGLFISSRTSTAATSAIVALLVWVLLIPILPNLSPYMAAEVTTTGSLAELQKQKREVIKVAWERHDETSKKYDKEHNIPDKWWEKGIPWDSDLIQQRRLFMQDEMLLALKGITNDQEKRNGEFMNVVDRQTALARNISRASFFSSFMYSLLAVGGEDGRDERQLRKQLVDYKNRLTEYGVGKETEQLRARIAKSKEYRFSATDTPKFEWAPLSLSSAAADVLVDLGLLLFWNLVFFMGAYLSFLKYDVR